MVKSTTKKPASKVGKPYADLPSLPHARGYWCKKVGRRLVYFGRLKLNRP